MKIIHISDLHFGTESGAVLGDLMKAIEQSGAHLVVISGDFTQIASTKEFKTAQRFVQNLPAPVFCVPGNHDIPRFDLWERFFDPYRKYKKYISGDLYPVFENDEVVIAGLNSARRVLPHWNWANGALSRAQLDHLERVYSTSPAKRRICVFHHPVHEAHGQPMDTIVFGARRVLRALERLQVDLVLTGHVHHASVTALGNADYKTVYLSASTALSSRLRKQENGFNVIEVGREFLNIDIRIYDGTSFRTVENHSSALL